MAEYKTHTSVLYDESINALNLNEGKVVIDGTFGAGGHSLGIAKIIGKKGTLISFDQDGEVFEKEIVEEIKKYTKFIPVVSNFRDMEREVLLLGYPEVDGVLLDLGLSSTQLEHSGRGFSFQRDEPLHMTFSDKPGEQLITAEVIVNEWQEGVIADVLFGFAEETFSRKIAKAIVETREKTRIVTTGQLVDIIKSSVPGWYQRKGRSNPATKTFQALRMAVNDEMGSTEDGIRAAHKILKEGGRLAVISFHSIEDRLVKNTFKEIYESYGGILLTKKPIVASEEELSVNPRSRSAKLRIIQK